jgi:hypothetical protein
MSEQWKQLFDMAYLRKNIVEELVVSSNSIEEEDSMDYTWKQYNEKYKTMLEVPELKKLVTPYYLFYCLGCNSFFREVFPNCSIEFTEEEQAP